MTFSDLYEDPVITSGDNDIAETDEFYNDIENTKDSLEVTSDEVYNDIDNVKTTLSEETTDEVYNDIENTKHPTPSESDDELYDDIVPVAKKRPIPEIPNTAPPPVPVRNNKDRPLPTSPTEKNKLAFHPKEDFENLFYGKWDCAAESNKELSFKQGEIIHIINRGHDRENWWVGELKGTIGLVPKTYLTAAYEAMTQKTAVI